MQVRQIDFAGSQSKFLAWLQKKMPGATELSIANIERSGSGLSNETFLFDLSWKEGGKSQSKGMVLRLPPKSFPVHPQYELNNQFRIMRILGKTNVPVPEVYWMEDDVEVLGAPFYLMGKLKGIVPPDYPPYHSFGMYFDATPAQRAKIWWGSVDATADVHRLDWKKLGFSFLGVPKGGTDAVDRRLDYLERFLNLAIWNPIMFERENGSRYAFFHYFFEYRGPGFKQARCQGGFEYPDGNRSLITSERLEIRFDARNKRFLGGKFAFTMADGTSRTLEYEPAGDTGFHLGAGLYHGGLGQHQGSWRGRSHLDGESFENCADPDIVERIGQFRDCMVKVLDPAGEAVGWGNCQTYVRGAWPEFGLL